VVSRLSKSYKIMVLRSHVSVVHVVLVNKSDGKKRTTVVPMHKELRKGTIRSFAKMAGLDVKKFGL
jgi:hypothetical protein